MSEEGIWDRLVNIWKENIRKNLAKISATIGQMIISILAIIMIIVREGYDMITALIIIAVALQPFFNWWINLIFKGESELKDNEIALLNQKLGYQQEISQYQIQLAAKNGKVPEIITHVYDWNEINRKLDELMNQNSSIKTETSEEISRLEAEIARLNQAIADQSS